MSFFFGTPSPVYIHITLCIYISFSELCPIDTIAYDDNCFWTVPGMSETNPNANDACEERGGTLAALPGTGTMGFLHHMWLVYKIFFNRYDIVNNKLACI